MEVKFVFIGIERDILTGEDIPVYEVYLSDEEGSEGGEDNKSSGS